MHRERMKLYVSVLKGLGMTNPDLMKPVIAIMGDLEEKHHDMDAVTEFLDVIEGWLRQGYKPTDEEVIKNAFEIHAKSKERQGKA